MRRFPKIFPLLIALTMLLAACTATFIPTAEPTNTPLPSSTPLPTDTPTPQPTATPTIPELALAYLDGDMNDVSYMTIEERTAFSEALVDELNARRGASPTTYNNEAYFDPNSLRMKKLDDGSTPEEQTIQLYLPVSEDAEGNLLLKYERDWLTISNSKDIDWNMIVTDPHDTRIKWPNTEKTVDGLTGPQGFLTLKKPEDGSQIYAIKPIIILDADVGQIFLEGTNGGFSEMKNTMKMVTVKQDEKGNPIFARVSIFMEATAKFFEENSDTEASDSSRFDKDGAFAQAIEGNQTYFVLLTIEQQFKFQNAPKSSVELWDGLEIATEDSGFFDNQFTENDNLMIAFIRALIKRTS